MPPSDSDKYDYAIAQAIKHERLRDPFNAYEWASMAPALVPGDPVALRHKEKAAIEIALLRSRSDSGSYPVLSLSEQEAFEKHLLLAESYLSNGATRLANRELCKARQIAPKHPLLSRLEQLAGIDDAPPTQAVSETSSVYDNDKHARTDSDRALLIRRIAVARSLAKSGLTDKARDIAHELLTAYGPLTEINDLFTALDTNNL